jgi:hypothetical protein
MSHFRSMTSGALVGGGLLGWLLLVASGALDGRGSQAGAQDTAGRADELAQLKAEIQKLKAETINAVAMNEVDYHAQNLWFAGKAANWPLADYYWKKLLVHMRMSLGEDRATASGEAKRTAPDVLRSVENAANMQVGRAIERKDVLAFNTTYRALLEGCYNCHKAEGLPFLRPRMPVKPAQAIINVDTRATWPN